MRGASHPRRRYLSVREGVVVRPHLRVHVVQVPLEAAALQPLAQGQPLGHVPEVHTRFCKAGSEAGAGVCGAPTTQATTQGGGAAGSTGTRSIPALRLPCLGTSCPPRTLQGPGQQG